MMKTDTGPLVETKPVLVYDNELDKVVLARVAGIEPRDVPPTALLTVYRPLPQGTVQVTVQLDSNATQDGSYRVVDVDPTRANVRDIIQRDRQEGYRVDAALRLYERMPSGAPLGWHRSTDLHPQQGAMERAHRARLSPELNETVPTPLAMPDGESGDTFDFEVKDEENPPGRDIAIHMEDGVQVVEVQSPVTLTRVEGLPPGASLVVRHVPRPPSGIAKASAFLDVVNTLRAFSPGEVFQMPVRYVEKRGEDYVWVHRVGLVMADDLIQAFANHATMLHIAEDRRK